MVGTITPVVHGLTHLGTWYRIIGVYALSQVAGAALTGLAAAGTGVLVWALCPWEATPFVMLLVLLAGIGALQDMQLLPLRLPSRCWQVPQHWQRFSLPIMAACYGFGIGLGVLTRIPFASFYVVLVACAGLASWPLGVGLLALYGAVRAGTVAMVARGQASAQDPHARLDTLVRLTPFIGYLDGLVLAFAAGVLLGQLLVFHR